MNLLNLAPAEAERRLTRWLATRKEPRFRLGQILPRLWQRPVSNWGEATELPLELRESLDHEAPLPRLECTQRQVSNDGTVKMLWKLSDGLAVESVWIPEGSRTTLCISSQAGCAYGCVFCATGRMGFQRHLACWEIASQVREMMLDPQFGKPSNVVFMGMGEPLHNWDAVDPTLTILNDPNGFCIGARHITVSTVGLIPGLKQLAARPEQFRLAVSLHSAISERRAALVPVERRYPLPDLQAALSEFARRVTLEYVMIQEVNDRKEDAAALVDLASRLYALVNLLPLHPGGHDLEPSPPRNIARFAQELRRAGINVSVRKSRGLDISAACGQLEANTDHEQRSVCSDQSLKQTSP